FLARATTPYPTPPTALGDDDHRQSPSLPFLPSVTVSSTFLPSRTTVIATLSPGRRRERRPTSSFTFVILPEPNFTMTSPTWSPPTSAGEPLVTSETSTPG